jgi:hypothetical protein
MKWPAVRLHGTLFETFGAAQLTWRPRHRTTRRLTHRLGEQMRCRPFFAPPCAGPPRAPVPAGAEALGVRSSVTKAIFPIPLTLPKGSLMKRICVWLCLVAASALVISPAKRVDAAGSPETRLIGLGVNFNILAPFTPARFYDINKQTGALTPLGTPFYLEEDRLGLNLAGNSGDELYNVLGASAFARVNRLALTGDVLSFVPFSDGTSPPPVVHATGFDSQDRLHGVLRYSGPSTAVVLPPVLAQINTTTGVATTLVELDLAAYSSIAFDLHDRLFAVVQGSGLARIDVSTGQTTIIGGDIKDPFSFGLEHKPILFDRDGTLFATTNRLVTVDPATGNTTPVGGATFDSNTIVGLALVSVPEPGALPLAGMAVILAALRKRVGQRETSESH